MSTRTIVAPSGEFRTYRIRGVLSGTYGKRGAVDLQAIASIFGLTHREIGELFGVERQAVQQWFKNGVPLLRVADVGRIAQAARALHDYFKPERIPQIVRQRVPAFRGKTVLDMARRDPSRIVELVAETRSYVPPASEKPIVRRRVL
jgi:hypothetical protein